jgi:hypothetical protein
MQPADSHDVDALHARAGGSTGAVSVSTETNHPSGLKEQINCFAAFGATTACSGSG